MGRQVDQIPLDQLIEAYIERVGDAFAEVVAAAREDERTRPCRSCIEPSDPTYASASDDPCRACVGDLHETIEMLRAQTNVSHPSA